MKVLRPGSTESLKSKDMSCSTMWHCQDIPASQRQQKLLTLQSGKGEQGLPQLLNRKKVQEKAKTSLSFILTSKTPSLKQSYSARAAALQPSVSIE